MRLICKVGVILATARNARPRANKARQLAPRSLEL